MPPVTLVPTTPSSESTAVSASKNGSKHAEVPAAPKYPSSESATPMGSVTLVSSCGSSPSRNTRSTCLRALAAPALASVRVPSSETRTHEVSADRASSPRSALYVATTSLRSASSRVASGDRTRDRRASLHPCSTHAAATPFTSSSTRACHCPASSCPQVDDAESASGPASVVRPEARVSLGDPPPCQLVLRRQPSCWRRVRGQKQQPAGRQLPFRPSRHAFSLWSSASPQSSSYI